eukprot:TRINITY_DN393_c1_g2_i2.p1 TRINITY_DN393_c1_g2~~TRINITY_DN393_c1_g2_i2.p1  ORF type:complete len:409 (+),score=47.78 TRINITY_DN393_c1_g2_i2:143-1369(+)
MSHGHETSIFNTIYYVKAALAGGICCSITHGAVCPLDVVKTRMQLDPIKYNNGMLAALRTILSAEGAGVLSTGLGATATGYFVQGWFKFGGVEFFKVHLASAMSQEEAWNRRTSIYLASSAMAEVIADLFLCPLEAVRIRSVSDPAFPKGLAAGAARMLAGEGPLGFYAGLGPILFKQVPYTMAKRISEMETADHQGGLSGVKKKIANKNWTYILRIGSFVSGGGLIAVGILGLIAINLNPLNYIVCIYLLLLGLLLIGAMVPWPKAWKKLTTKYVPFLHTYRGRGLYMIFTGTLSTGTGWIAIIIGIGITICGLLHCIIAFFFRDALEKKSDLDEPDDGKPVTMDSFKQEFKEAAVQTAWDNRETIQKAAWDNREVIAQTAMENKEFVADNAGTFVNVAMNNNPSHY